MAKKGFFKRASLRALYFLLVILLLIVAGEITARAMGFRPWKPQVQTIKVEPEGRFFQDDALLGYKGKPGHFKLLLQDSLKFEVTHNSEGWRICMPDTIAADTRPEIWIFGCSFTHGYGVNDSENFPWLLQTEFQQFKVLNYGMDGYGTLQNWLQMKKLLDQGRKPALVILAYGAFHDQRNTANRYWRKALHGQEIAEDISYPFIRLNDKDSLITQYSKLDYHPLPTQTWLALPSLIEENWNKNEDAGLRSNFVTEALIEKMNVASANVSAKFLLAGIYQHPETSKMLKIFHLANTPTVEISQDLNRPELRILPGNGHPNAAAHQLMANQLISYLKENQNLLGVSSEE